MTMRYGHVPTGIIYFCRYCGCDDLNACVDENGHPCAWVLLDVETPSGICSACAEDCNYNQRVFLFAGRQEAGHV
jgi:hypothetical protein